MRHPERSRLPMAQQKRAHCKFDEMFKQTVAQRKNARTCVQSTLLRPIGGRLMDLSQLNRGDLVQDDTCRMHEDKYERRRMSRTLRRRPYPGNHHVLS